MKVQFRQKYINYIVLENMMHKYYHKSLSDDVHEIYFELSSVKYIDLPQLCILFMWISTLSAGNKNITINFIDYNNDTCSSVYNIAFNYGLFSEIYELDNIIINPAVHIAKSIVNNNIIDDSPLIHLRSFNDSNEFESFIKSVEYNQIKNYYLFQDDDLLTRTGIRDVFLKELGQNVFVHSEGSPAILAVCKKTKAQLRYSSNPSPIKDFANRSKTNEYVQVVVADTGIGLINKLKTVFELDLDAHEELDNTKETSIISYAFWKDTTSRTSRKEEESLDEEDELLEYGTPTGLYFVKKLLNKRKGLMYFRTNKSIWTLDCSGPEENYVDAIEWHRDYCNGSLHEFRGNLIVIYMPIPVIQKAPISIQSIANNKQINISHYINCKDIFNNNKNEVLASREIVKLIKRKSRLLKNNSAVLIDISYTPMHMKRLYAIALCSMYYQEQDKFMLLCDAANDCDIEVVQSDILRLNKNTNLHSLLYVNTTDNKSTIIMVQENDDSARLSTLDIGNLLEKIASTRQGSVMKMVENVFDKNAKVLLPPPSRMYVKGYYDISKLLDNSIFIERVSDYCANKVFKYEISKIVTTTPSLQNIASDIAERIKLDTSKIHLVKGESLPITAAIEYDKAGSHILLISDVISSGKTVERIAGIFKQPIIVFSIVDARQHDTRPGNVTQYIEILKRQLQITSEKPSSWKYDDIQMVDPISHKLIKSNERKYDYLWNSNDIIHSWAKEAGFLKIGHFTTGSTCYPFFFNTFSIYEKHKNEIFEIINLDIKDIVSKHNKEIRYLSYIKNNQPAQSIINNLSQHFDAEIITLSKLETEYGTFYTDYSSTSNEEMSGIMIFIDTASTTTRTIRHAIDMARYKGVQSIVIYIVINRISGDWSFIEGINNYNGVEVHIRSLIKSPLPAYSSFMTCPLCNRKLQLEQRVTALRNMRVSKVLAPVIEKLERRLIDDERTSKAQSNSSIEEIDEMFLFRIKLQMLMDNFLPQRRDDLIDQINESINLPLKRNAIIYALHLESETLFSDEYKQIKWDSIFLKSINSLTSIILRDNQTSNMNKISAIWVASKLNSDDMLKDIISVDNIITDDSIAINLIAAMLLNVKTANQKIASNCLEKIATLASKNISPDVLLAMKQVALTYSLTYDNYSDDNKYKTAFKKISYIYEQPGKTHPDIRRKYDKIAKIVLKEDLKTIVDKDFDGKNGFYNLIVEDILPAISRVLYSWPSDLTSELKYFSNNKILEDISRLSQLFSISIAKIDECKMTDIEWNETKKSIYDITRRLFDELIYPDDSPLKRAIDLCNTDVAQVMADVVEKVHDETIRRDIKIIISQKETFCNVILPKQIIEDVVTTIIDNAIKYSRESTSIIIDLCELDGMLEVKSQSIPVEGKFPSIIIGHGLERLATLLHKSDGSLGIDESSEAIAVIRVNLPIWR